MSDEYKYPSAYELRLKQREEAIKSQLDDVFEKITETADESPDTTSCYYSDDRLREATIEKLEELGYKVETRFYEDISYNDPYYIISWD